MAKKVPLFFNHTFKTKTTMTNETQNKFAAILAQAQQQAKTKTVLKSVQPAKVEPPKIEVITETVKDIDARPELSTMTFNDIIKEVTPIEKPLQIVDYSPKSFAVVGPHTKQQKDKLRSLGGNYNAFLKCGKGWIFSNKHLPAVKLFVELYNQDNK